MKKTDGLCAGYRKKESLSGIPHRTRFFVRMMRIQSSFFPHPEQ